MLSLLDPMKDNAPVASLRAYISNGGYEPGDRLPAERELTAKLNMTRTTLRKALDALEREGKLWRHVGKGTFIASGGGDKSANGLVELGRHLTPFRMMRARLTIEPAIAREAAVNASGKAITQMQLAMEGAHSATSWRDYETQDDLFHRSIAQASDNLLLLALFDQLNQVRRAVAWGNVTRQTTHPAQDHPSFGEHKILAATIADRDPKAADDAMRKHLRSVSERLFEEV